ncbi:MAG: hypothetical protein V8T85_17005 [Blautia faecicola]
MYSLNKDVADFNEDGYLKGISDGTATIVAEWGRKDRNCNCCSKNDAKTSGSLF